MRVGDTIAAIASGPGRSARGLIRVSGPGARAVLDALGAGGAFTPGAAAARIAWTGGAGLPVLLLRFAAPRSYTGEDTAEILLPGNPALIERVLARLLGEPGVRHAEPGEFTARAYLNGKLTLAQAEGVAATIAARTDEQLAAARELLGGTIGARYRAWTDELADLLALVEAGIDFTDQEDVTPIAGAELSRRLARLGDEVGAFLGAAGGGESARALPRVVLAGPPNAGKSTLFNALLGRRRAVVSPIAGTTRDVLQEPLDVSRDAPGAEAVLLTDIAGLDDGAAGPIAADAQSRARAAIGAADAVIACDPSGRFGPLPVARGTPVIRVRTKADLPASGASAGLPVCALDGRNLGPLRGAIADAAWSGRGAGVAALLPRHRRTLSAARDGLRAAGALAGASDPAALADHLRAALDALGELAGRVTPDDILGRVFSTFCVGK